MTDTPTSSHAHLSAVLGNMLTATAMFRLVAETWPEALNTAKAVVPVDADCVSIVGLTAALRRMEADLAAVKVAVSRVQPKPRAEVYDAGAFRRIRVSDLAAEIKP